MEFFFAEDMSQVLAAALESPDAGRRDGDVLDESGVTLDGIETAGEIGNDGARSVA